MTLRWRKFSYSDTPLEREPCVMVSIQRTCFTGYYCQDGWIIDFCDMDEGPAATVDYWLYESDLLATLPKGEP